MENELLLTVKEKADHWRTVMAKGAVDKLIAELQDIPDETLVNAVSRKVKIKLNII